MSIYKSAVNKPITTIMVFVAVAIFGIYSLIQVPVNMMPEMDPLFISVTTTYSGASAQDIETNVSRPLEDALSTIDNLSEINSTSQENLSSIQLEFTTGADLNEASNDIRDALDRVALPDDCGDPMLMKFSMDDMPILYYAISAGESYMGLENIIDENVVNALNQVDGVASVTLMGAPERVIYVELDPYKINEYGLTLEAVSSVISAENRDMPSGSIKMGKMEYQLRIEGEFAESDEINDLVIASINGKNIYLRDVAEVKDQLADITLEEKINGQTGARMFIMKRSGANTVDVAKNVKERMLEIEKTLPADIQIQEIMDSSAFITTSISNLSTTLLWSLIFVVLVVLFFLGRWRATFIVVITIPFSLIVSFIYMNLSGTTINIISLSSLSIAIGMVVDDAIVVLENITKHIERGASPRDAAIYATNEVWLAVLVTTLVVVAVFFPLTMIEGDMSILFKQLGWIVSITVVVSTLAAITLTPMMASKLMHLRQKKSSSKFSYENTIEKLLNKVDNWYEAILRWCLRRKKLVVLLAALIFGSSMLLFMDIKTENMPQTDQGMLQAEIKVQTGLKLEESSILVDKLVEDISKIPEVKLLSSSVGSSTSSFMTSSGSNIINLMVRLTDSDERERSIWDISEELQTYIDKYPEVTDYDVSTASMSMSTNTVEVNIFGYDLDATSLYATELKEKLNDVKGITNIKISRDKDKPELQIVLDREKLATLGLNTTTVSSYIRNMVSGSTASLFKEDGDEYDIIVRLKEEYRNSISNIEDLMISTPSGEKVRLKEIGSIVEYWSPPSIERKDKQRFVTVEVTPKNASSMTTLVKNIQNIIDESEVPSGINIDITGAYEEMQDTFADLIMLVILCLMLVFTVMASQFESMKMPLIIMFSIPFAFTGVIIALFLTNTALSVISGLGAVMLIGIVVKNGIVLVDYINLMRDRGIELYEAIALSGRSRLRPVLMTALTTILGMLPLAISQGEGSEMWKPMGIVIIGGLIFSTIVTMVIVPVMYAVFTQKGDRNKTNKLRKNYIFLEKK